MVKCEICGKEMRWIQNTHLKKHGITLGEYRELYPDSLTITQEMTQEIIRTRVRNHRVPIKLCAREGCNAPVKHWKENKYCSCRCASQENYKNNLKQYATREGNPGYIDGDYSQCKAQKQLAYERDGGCCVICGQPVDGISNKYGVHHWVPRRLIEDKELADSLDNLGTLCSKHHKQVESMFVDEIFALYSRGDFKPIKDLMSYIKQQII